MLSFANGCIFLLFVCFTSASRQLKSFIDKEDDDRKLKVQILPPPIDDCTSAVIIPSDFPGASYTTPGVSIVNATRNSGQPHHFCYIPPEQNKNAWYQFTPSTTNFYGFSTNLGDTHMVFFSHNVEATTCKNAYQVYCTAARPSIDVKLDANVTYLLKVYRSLANVTGLLQLVVQRRRPPSNNLCTNATIIDPTVETFMTSDDNTYALHDENADFPLYSTCNAYETPFNPRPTFWYKFTNPLSTPLSVDIAVDVAKTDVATSIGIVRGVNCSVLRCVGGLTSPHDRTTTYDFVAEPLTAYNILLKLSSSDPFNITIKGRPQFFSLIDSTTDKAIQLLRDSIDYYQIQSNSVNLNLRARFALPPKTIKSVRLTYDNPKRNVCDQKAPYSVFGDLKGDYSNATIPLGRHKVTATPYTLPNCKGEPGTALSQDFKVTGCPTNFVIQFDATGRELTLSPFTSAQASQDGYTHTKLPVKLSLQCRVNMFMYYDCGFPVQSVRTELRNARTGTLFRTSNSTYIMKNYHLPAGVYSLRAIIDGVSHPTMNFTVINTTCDK